MDVDIVNGDVDGELGDKAENVDEGRSSQRCFNYGVLRHFEKVCSWRT